ncbi:hypothetical protein Tco_1556917 [Tanacetum coccineum]
MCTYLKNMEGKKLKDLKNKYFDSIQEMFDRAFKRVNTFVDFRTALVEDSSKRAGTELEQEVTKKQKVDDVQETAEVDDDKETVELQRLIKIIPDEEEVANDAIPLATKPPTIDATYAHSHTSRKDISPYTCYNYCLRINEVFGSILLVIKSFNKNLMDFGDIISSLGEEMFDRAFKRVNTFVDFRTALVEDSSKRAGTELEQEVIKKQKVDDVQETTKVDDDKETAELQSLIKIIPNEEEVANDAIPFATKPPTIVEWKIHKEGKKTIIGSSELMEVQRPKYGSTRPVEDLDLILWGDLKTMFKPHVEDRVWRNQ